MSKERLPALVGVSDLNQWKVIRGTNNIGYSKYLLSAINMSDEIDKVYYLYNTLTNRFMKVLNSKIEIASSGESFIKYGSTSWYSRNKKSICLSYMELILKRECILNNDDYTDTVRKLYQLNREELLKVIEYKSLPKHEKDV